ncbi:Lrp/AsnC family transcriptional regulator [Frondihabitans australicus]|uniref:DNA-binding Lrp family transcriptional regulator n=1 Tax=Frondihabitans australicus TaxID=386892 RepID=A0A495IF73_9MICO|nr:Lrp/AsnC family transcriptional regulator [Frondihabitans australicus]RKR74647.1 DNA-binding Lrp family transcriptional regulator [Frondihabitans australicus]
MLDTTDRRLLSALDANPRTPAAVLADALSLARGTVQHRLERFATGRDLRPASTRVRPSALGLPMRAIVTATIRQSERARTMAGLTAIPQIVECLSVTGADDLLCHVVARDTEHLLEVGQAILSVPGIERTSTAVVLEEPLEYRVAQLF